MENPWICQGISFYKMSGYSVTGLSLKCIQLTGDISIAVLKATPDVSKTQASALLTFFKHDQV